MVRLKSSLKNFAKNKGIVQYQSDKNNKQDSNNVNDIVTTK